MNSTATPQVETRYDVRVVTEIRADLADWLAERAGDDRRSLRDQASWFLEQALSRDRARATGARTVQRSA